MATLQLETGNERKYSKNYLTNIKIFVIYSQSFAIWTKI